MNRKGNAMVMIYVVLALFLVLIFGFVMITGSSILNWVMDESMPLVNDLGLIENTNMTEAVDITVTPVNTFLQSFTWMTGVLYVLMLIGSVAIAFIARGTSSKWLIGFYFSLVVLLIIGSIFMSNIYEDFQDDNGELGTRLNEHTLLSFMILNSPAIFTVIAFLTGIILFSGMQEEEFV